jgi:hypothetical protein
MTKTTANDLLLAVADIIEQRATLRDCPSGERSISRAVLGFNAITGADLEELECWIFMLHLKLARATQGELHTDDWLDLIGYAALAAECAINKAKQPTTPPSRIEPNLFWETDLTTDRTGH